MYLHVHTMYHVCTCTHYIKCMSCIYTLYVFTCTCTHYTVMYMYLHVHTILLNVFTCTHYTVKCIYTYTLYC